jgi:Histidine kinase-, DNA gyrase B-, and HSP90-like ATPase
MAKAIDSIDPLEAKSASATAAAQAAIKRDIENILTSYVGWFDPIAELVQNALDSVEERKLKEPKKYTPKIRIVINLKENSLTVSDNGVGLSEEAIRQFLAPSFSFKSGKTRGHKGVGATFLAYGYNYIQIASSTSDFKYLGKMENARKWLSDPSPPSNPLLVKDKGTCLDPKFSDFDKGVSITLRFDASTYPGNLEWLKADTAKVWKDLLLIKTGLGAVLSPLDVEVELVVYAKNGAKTSTSFNDAEYKWPHTILPKSKKLREIIKKADELFKKSGKSYRMPADFRKLDCLYEVITPKELPDFVNLTDDEQKIVVAYKPVIYLCYAYTARIWADYNAKLGIRSNVDALKPGIQIAANSMPQGEVIQIPLKRYTGRQDQVHFLAHFDNCKADLGRKGFQKDIVVFCEEIARKLIEGPFQKHRDLLRPTTGAKADLVRETKIDDWKLEMLQHEKASPLVLTNPNFFLPEKKISITSAPTREQDVIALFNQLIAGGVIRGIKIMSTNERFTYDGMYRVSIAPPKANHIYNAKTNPLGVLEENLPEDGLLSQPKILEYKYTLDGLIEDISAGEKNVKDVGLVVVWDTGKLYEGQHYIVSLLDPANLSERQYHGVTHVIQNYQTQAREMDLIVLKELIDYLNNPKKTIAAQKKKYET